MTVTNKIYNAYSSRIKFGRKRGIGLIRLLQHIYRSLAPIMKNKNKIKANNNENKITNSCNTNL